MNRPAVCCSLAVLLLAAVSAQGRVTAAAGSLRGWNIVLVTLDATSPQRIGTYGGSPRVMPYFDSLAKESLVIDHAYCTTGATGPSHATMMTGLLPYQHRVLYNGHVLPPDVWWLPQELQKRGYFTAGSTIAFFMGRGYGFDRGWSSFACATTQNTPIGTNAAARDLFADPLAALAGRRGPFFAWVHLKGGHSPLTPIAKEDLELFAQGASLAEPPAKYDEELATPAERHEVDQAWLKYYDANLHEADRQLHALLDSFRHAGLMKNTLVVILGDHGETFDHGILEEHWSSPWESTLHIPMIFYSESPGIPKGHMDDRLVTTEDLVPTFLYLLGITEGPPHSEGKNIFGVEARQDLSAASSSAMTYEDYEVQALALLPHATDEANRPVFEKLRANAADLERTGTFYWALIKRTPDGRIHKLIHFGYSPKRAVLAAGSGAVQLYEVTTDPEEAHDLVSEERATAASMLHEARANPLFGRIGAVDGLTSANPAAMTQWLDKEAVEKLKALGYLH